MNDFQIVSAKVILPVQSFAPIRGFLPVSIVVVGSDFDKTSEVYYNDTLVTEFIVNSPARMVVRVPDSQVGKSFQSIRVLSTAMATKKDAVLSFGIGNPAQFTSGLDRLVQAWAMVFLTTPGSDIFDLESGGGARSIIGRNTDRRGKGVSADLAHAIDRTKTELLRLQSKYPNLPLDEKILNASLASLTFDSKTTSLLARVELSNMMGQAAEVSFKG